MVELRPLFAKLLPFTTISMPHPFENHRFSPKARSLDLFQIHGMEDYYLGVVFQYSRTSWNGCIPLIPKYRGVEVPFTMEDVEDWVLKCYANLDPSNNTAWQNAQRSFWLNANASETENVFDALNGMVELNLSLSGSAENVVPSLNAIPSLRHASSGSSRWAFLSGHRKCLAPRAELRPFSTF